MKPATMAEGDVSASGRSGACVASVMTAVFLMMSVGGEIPAEPCGSGLAREGVCTFGIDIGWHTAIASKPAPTEIADSVFKPKLKCKQALPYSGRDKQPYSRVATTHCVQSP
ncbi:hypothetical protein EMIT0P12_20624 [Pseudomonas sp. IT-P12]